MSADVLITENELADAARQHAGKVGVGSNDPSEVALLKDERFDVGVSDAAVSFADYSLTSKNMWSWRFIAAVWCGSQ